MNEAQRRKWLIIAAISVIGLYAADRLVLSPLVSTWTNRSERIQELKTQLTEARSLVNREDALERRWAEMVETSLPANQGEAENLVLRSVGEWAEDAGFELASLKPRWGELDEAAIALECRATGNGSMQQVVQFIHSIEMGPLALRVDEFSLTANDESGSRLGLDVRISGLIIGNGRT